MYDLLNLLVHVGHYHPVYSLFSCLPFDCFQVLSTCGLLQVITKQVTL